MQERTLGMLLEMGERVERAKSEERRAVGASTPMRSAEEIARDMVEEQLVSRTTGKTVLRLRFGGFAAYAEVDPAEEAGDVRAVLASLIEQSRAEGAAAERERMTEEMQSVRDERDHWQRSHDSCVDELKRVYDASQPRDLAGRIRALVQEYAGRWADADDGAADEQLHDLMERLVQAAAFARRGASLALLIDDMRAAHPAAADKLEAIVRECAAQERR